MATISKPLTELIAQKERIASEVNAQSEKITAIKSDIYDILESDEIPKGKLVSVIDRTVTELTESDLDGCTSIGDYAFNGCKNLANITLPNSVVAVAQYTFQNCNNLKVVKYLGNIDEWLQIDFAGFYTNYSNPLSYGADLYINNEKLKQLNVSTTIKKNAFQGCKSLENINIREGASYIGENAFKGCTNLLSATIGNSVTNIGNNAFYGCSGLTNIILSNSLTTINDSTFLSCNNLTSITIPNSVTKINVSAFNTCRKLVDITIGSGVTSISSNAFSLGSNTYGGTVFRFLGITPPTIVSNAFATNDIKQIIVPKGCGDAYKSATNWSNFANYIVEASE